MSDSKVLQLDGLVTYQAGSIVSRTIVKNSSGSVTQPPFGKGGKVRKKKSSQLIKET